MDIVHRLQLDSKKLLRLLLGVWLLTAFSAMVSANSDRFKHYEFGRTDAKYAVNIELNKLDKLYIRHGAAIDGFIYTYRSDGQNYQIGGDGGTLSAIDLKGLTKVVVHSGNFYWGSAEKATIVKIEFHYSNGEQHSYGSTQYATSVIKNEHLVRPELLSLSFWSDGWLINGVRFNYPRLDSAESPAEFVEDLPTHAIKTAQTQAGNDFLYVVMPTSKRIGLLTYDGIHTLDVSTKQLKPQQVIILECGSSKGFVPRAAVRNHENVLGVTGYESIDDNCHLARNREFKWFDAQSIGLTFWYSNSLSGDAQCYSLDGQRCINQLDYNQQVEINNRFTLQRLAAKANNIAQYLNNTNQLTLTITNYPQSNHNITSLTLPGALEQTINSSIQHSPIGQTKRVIVNVVNTADPVTVYLPNQQAQPLSSGERKVWTYIAGEWFEEGRNLNDYPDIVRRARPVTCGQSQIRAQGFNGYDFPNHWCARAASMGQNLRHKTVQANMDATISNMDALFTQMEAYQTQKINRKFQPHIDALQNRVERKKRKMNNQCGWSFFVPMAIVCAVTTSEYNDLKDALDDLNKQYQASLKAAKDKVQQGRSLRWHTLHKSWARNDKTHFAALLKEESQTLAALRELKIGYDKSAQVAKAEYQAAMKKYLKDSSPKQVLLTGVEALPLVGPEIKHIVAYARHPSAKNLRRMLLGLAGPVGETVEGIVELTTEPGALNQKEIKFLTDVLTDLSKDSSVGEALQDVVSDAINDLGDEVIESIRQAGLWRDNPGETNLIQSDYQNLVDLRSQARQIDYDFWQGNSSAEINVQNKFTPQSRQYASFIATPKQFDPDSLTDIELASGGSLFATQLATIFNHAFGKGYEKVAQSNKAYAIWTREQVTDELYKVIADPAYYEQRLPYWVDSATIGNRPAGLIFNKQHAMIVINSDLVTRNSRDFYKFYFEELGHLLNWWRCTLFAVDVSQCQTPGDAGARFRDAVMLDPALHTTSLPALLAELPQHPNVDVQTVQFSDNSFATLEGWPEYYTVNDHIGGGGKFSWLMRLGLDLASQEFKGVVDEFDLEVIINAPSPAMKGDPWKKSANGYCKTDSDTDCNMPTMWMSIAFRDSLKVVSSSLPTFKNATVSKAGFDLLPMLVRKHGGKLPFQLSSVNSTDWRYMGSHDIYYKKFTGSLVARLNLWKTQKVMRGQTAGTTFKPEISLKTVPAAGSYVVEIATRDKDDFAAWLAADVASAVGGCAVGFAIGVIAETDPVVMCHAMSDLTEIIETAFQGLDKRPTMFFEADGNVALPVSLEYRYATSGDKIRRGSVTEPPAGRVQYSAEGRAQYLVGDVSGSIPEADISRNRGSITTNPQVSSFKAKAGKAFTKLGAKPINPVAVFRFRVGFDYAEKVMHKGAYALPSAIVED